MALAPSLETTLAALAIAVRFVHIVPDTVLAGALYVLNNTADRTTDRTTLGLLARSHRILKGEQLRRQALLN